MNATPNPELRTHYIETLRGHLAERILDPTVVHASECELCPMKPFYNRTLDEIPPLSDQSILFFTRGRLFERFISQERPPLELDGICGTVDGTTPDGELIEIKSTLQDMDKFNPASSQPHWIQRSKAYATIYGVNVINLVVFFLVGNMWTHKTEPTGLKSWRLEFTPEELADNWDYILLQRDKLLRAIGAGELPDEAWVKGRRMGFECKSCQFSVMCPYFNGK